MSTVSTRRPALHRASLALVTLAAGAIGLLAAGAAQAKPIVYTLRVMADGSFRGVAFYHVPLTIRMTAATETVQSEPGANGGTVYTNRVGQATLTIPGFPTATFADGEVYVRYDTGNGIFGFGSPIGPTYPVALGCADFTTGAYTADCTQGDFVAGNSNTYNGIATALADPTNAATQSLSNPTLALLPIDLTQATLLTGIAHECATVYNSDAAGNLYDCAGDAPRGLRTDKGRLFLRQRWSLSQPAFGFDSTNNGSILSYTGYLHAELAGE